MNGRTVESIKAMHCDCDVMIGVVSAILKTDETISPQKQAMLRDARLNLLCARNWLMATERSGPQETRAGEPVSETELPQGLALETFKPAPEKDESRRGQHTGGRP